MDATSDTLSFLASCEAWWRWLETATAEELELAAAVPERMSPLGFAALQLASPPDPAVEPIKDSGTLKAPSYVQAFGFRPYIGSSGYELTTETVRAKTALPDAGMSGNKGSRGEPSQPET